MVDDDDESEEAEDINEHSVDEELNSPFNTTSEEEEDDKEHIKSIRTYSRIHLFLRVFICFAVFLQDLTCLRFNYGQIGHSFLYPTRQFPFD